MANLTITPERAELMDFPDPVFIGVNEIVVPGPRSPRIINRDNLARQDVFVRESSSYY